MKQEGAKSRAGSRDMKIHIELCTHKALKEEEEGSGAAAAAGRGRARAGVRAGEEHEARTNEEGEASVAPA